MPKREPKIRVLLADDEVGMTRMLKRNLEDLGGYTVRMENEALKVVEAAQAFGPDIILLDVIMPNRNGVMLAHDLRADARLRAVPVVFLTAMASKDAPRAHPLSLEGYPVLVKPIGLDQIVRCIDAQLRRPEATSAGAAEPA